MGRTSNINDRSWRYQPQTFEDNMNSRQILQDAWFAYNKALAERSTNDSNNDLLTKADLHYALFDRILDEDACGGDSQERVAVGLQLEKAQWKKLSSTQLGELVEWCNKWWYTGLT